MTLYHSIKATISRNSFVLLVMGLMVLLTRPGQAQSVAGLQPGFIPTEYDALLQVMNAVMDSTPNLRIEAHGQTLTRQYRSPEVGLLNRWELYKRQDGVAIIHIRGTINKPVSWLANFYAAMVPATGKLVLAPRDTFRYQLAQRKEAAVHVGWLVSLAYLVRDMQPVLAKERQAGTKQFIIAGHSQGAAISALLRAYVQYQDLLGAEAAVKTYLSAAPKPADLFFATDFDHYTRNGWAFRVVNSYDWVPQTPFSTQTIADFNKLNPFSGAEAAIKKRDFLTRLYLNMAYRNIHNKTDQASGVFRGYLGNDVYLLIKKALPGFQKPQYANSNNYYPAGSIISLVPNADYFKLYPDTSSNVFTHHMPKPYMYLLKAGYEVK